MVWCSASGWFFGLTLDATMLIRLAGGLEGSLAPGDSPSHRSAARYGSPSRRIATSKALLARSPSSRHSLTEPRPKAVGYRGVMTKRTAIIAGTRTPFVRSGTVFKDLTAIDLGVLAVRELMDRSGVRGEDVDHLVFGTVVHDPHAPNIAREVGLPPCPRPCPP